MILRGLVVLLGAFVLFGAGWGLYGTVTGMLQNRPHSDVQPVDPDPETDLVPGQSESEEPSAAVPEETPAPAPSATSLEAAWLKTKDMTSGGSRTAGSRFPTLWRMPPGRDRTPWWCR